MKRISREQVEKTINDSSRTFHCVIITYFGREEPVEYSDLNKVNWNNVQRASVEFKEYKTVYPKDYGEPVSSKRRRVR